MVEFRYEPWKEIIVHEVLKRPLQTFLKESSMGIPQGGIGRPILWVDGIIFTRSQLPDTDDIVREKIKGILHYNSVNYTVHEKYQPEFKVEGNIRIPVFDVTNNNIFREMAVWIKENFEK
ncbi:MAG: hypothetical protein OEY40_02520 [Candidatus Bathyarchaeota archaeon]|nr:hypothetical protein [Candidatus Bathyarchaeota archaeon]MDH5595573.1 hypothetical protein [Candidatus Bathyarchaeota archaeon]